MTHPNEWPGKKFIPYEGDMSVENKVMPAPTIDREGITTVEADTDSATVQDPESTPDLTVARAPKLPRGVLRGSFSTNIGDK